MIRFIVGFFVAGALATISVPLVQYLARKFRALDWPDGLRKLHQSSTPLWGGLAISGAVLVVMVTVQQLGWLGRPLLIPQLVGICLAIIVLTIGGVIDDRFNLKPKWQIIFPILASVIVIASGITIQKITNPFGGNIVLGSLGVVLTFLWLMTLTYTTKLLDGLDGLVSGLVVIGSLIIAAVALRPPYNTPSVAVLALIVAGAFAGFLPGNMPPAKIFLGEAGATLAGFLLGVLAILAASKIATALLVVGVPLVDMGVVVIQRFRAGQSPFRGDRRHLHFRLLETNSHPLRTILIFWGLAAAFGVTTLILPSWGKVLAIVLLAGLTLFLVRHIDAKAQSKV